MAVLRSGALRRALRKTFETQSDRPWARRGSEGQVLHVHWRRGRRGFMSIYYRLSGFIAIAAMILNMLT